VSDDLLSLLKSRKEDIYVRIWSTDAYKIFFKISKASTIKGASSVVRWKVREQVTR
jgi:hypothetical protein